MPEYTWSPPTHPDPPEDQPLGVPAPDGHRAVDHAPAWAEVDFTRTGHQRVPGFVDAVGDGRVLVQFVHMGFAHKVWLPTSHTEPRELRRRAPRG